MSKIGKKLILIPDSAKVSFLNTILVIKGPLGIIRVKNSQFINVLLSPIELSLKPKFFSNISLSLWGLFRSIVFNAIHGVCFGFKKILVICGVGYKVVMSLDILRFSLGYSHEVFYCIPKNIRVICKSNSIEVFGFNNQLVGQVSSDIRSIRSCQIYTGKGVKYFNEHVIRREGKKSK